MEGTHLTQKFPSHVIADTGWKDLVPVLARVRDLGIMIFQHVLEVMIK